MFKIIVYYNDEAAWNYELKKLKKHGRVPGKNAKQQKKAENAAKKSVLQKKFDRGISGMYR